MVSIPAKRNLSLFFVWLGYSEACEGPCIVGLTKALIGNYSKVVGSAMDTISSDIAKELLPGQTIDKVKRILNPVISQHQKNAYNAMEAAEFPGFFHGKCQVNGADPKGCPNPDCPVVCGTPGSIIHFYPTFINIAFNTTSQGIANVTSPTNSSSQFNQIQNQVTSTCQSDMKRRKQISRFSLFTEIEGCPDESKIQSFLEKILGSDNIQSVMENECGGSNLPNCTWIDQGMKDYVLSWP